MVMGNGADVDASRVHVIDFGIATEMDTEPNKVETADDMARYVLNTQEIASHVLYCCRV